MAALFQFFRDSYDELKRVTWLTRAQMIASTWLVILIVIIFSIYVGIIDFIIARLFGLLI